MKNFLIFILIFVSFQNEILSQCIDCDNLKEALIAPSGVKSLDLSHEKLKLVPKEIELFTELEELDLSYNLLEDFQIDLSKLTHLKRLDLSDNPNLNFFEFPSSFFSSGIESLNLAKNNLFFVPENFGSLKNLETLDLSNNNITFLPPSFDYLVKLKYLNLSFNNLKEDNFYLNQLWDLEYLQLENNPKLSLENVFISLQNKENLQELSFSQNENKLPIGAMNNLSIRKIKIKNSSINYINPNFSNIKNLQEISFDNCDFIEAKNLYNDLNELKQITKISFKNSKLEGDLKDLSSKKELIFIDAIIENEEDLIKRNKVQIINSTNLDSVLIQQTNLQNPMFSLSENMLRNQVEKVVDVKIEKHEIQADTPCKIQSENTIFDIPKNAFLDQNLKPYSGTVKIEIKEYFDPISIALAGVPMIMNESGTPELFSSSGMFEFNAYDDKGNKLNPNPQNIIQVEMENTQQNTQADLFSYNDSLKNWERLQKNVNTLQNSSSQNSIMDSLNALPDSLFAQMHLVHVPMKLQYLNQKGNKHKFKETRKYYLTLKHHKHEFYVNQKKLFYNNKSTTFYTEDKGLKFLENSYLIIDSLIYPEHNELIKLIASDTANVKIFTNKKLYDFTPRNYSDVKVSADFEKDKFMFQFSYKGKKFDVPLIIESKKSLKNYQKENYDFYRKYLRYEEKNQAEIDKAKLHFEKNRKKFADLNRILRANELLNPSLRLSNERTKFGLQKFGLVNCDYFYRNPPANYIATADSMRDQNNVKIFVPSTTRLIIRSDNTYLESESSRVPQYLFKKIIFFYVLNSLEIAVVKSWTKLKNGQSVPNVKRFSTVGLTEEEIRKSILD